MKLLRALLQETMGSVEGSSTISNVFVRNGGGPKSCKPSIGRGDKLEDDEDDEPTVPAIISSSFTATPAMVSPQRCELYIQVRVSGIGCCWF